MSTFRCILAAAVAAAAVESIAPAPPAEVVYLNANGGSTFNDLGFTWGLADFDITTGGSRWTDESDPIDGITMSKNAGFMLGVGNTVYWGNGGARIPGPATYASFDSIINSGGSEDGSGIFTSVLTADGDYIVTITGSYTFPNKFVKLTAHVEVPDRHESGVEVRVYVYMDTEALEFDGSTDVSPGFFTTYPITAVGSVFPLEEGGSPLYQAAFYYLGGAPWTGWTASTDNCGIMENVCENNNPGFGPESGPAYGNDFNQVIFNDDNGASISILMGSEPGHYSTTFAVGVMLDSEFASTYFIRSSPEVVAYWIGFAFFLFGALYTFFRSALLRGGPVKAAYYLVMLINIVGALAYLVAVLSDNKFALGCTGREFEWLRYAAWAAQAPLSIALLAIVSRVTIFQAVWSMVLSVVGVGALFAGAVSPNCVSAWPLLAFAIATGLALTAQLFGEFYKSIKNNVSSTLQGTLRAIIIAWIFLWAGYAIVWGVSEAGKVATVAQEIITYTVLDILTKVITPLILILNARSALAHGHALAWMGASSDALDISISHKA